MKIGFLTPTEPYPPNEGGRIVAYNHIRRLAERGHDVRVFATVDSRSSPPSELLETVSECRYFERDRSPSAYLRGLDRPFSVASRHVPALKSALDEQADELDVLVAEHTHMASYLEEASIPSCLCVHNVEHASLLSNARSSLPSPRSLAFLLDAGRMLLFERDLYRTPRADAFAFLSREELANVSDRYSNLADRAWHSPVGVEMGKFEDLPRPAAFDGSANRIVFTGTMRYPPNVEAVTWFANEVFPRVREVVPDAEFFIVGKSPTPTVEDLGERPGISVTGLVDETATFISHADVSVVPLLEGTGVQVKLVEALAAGSPTVATPVSISGTSVVDGEHALVRDTPSSFAQAVIDVLRYDTDAAELGRRARNLAESTYAWETVMDEFEARLRVLR